jgi:hypothetical protein
MLNGVAPIMIFHFYSNAASNTSAGIALPSDIINAVGIPIPIYFDERVSDFSRTPTDPDNAVPRASGIIIDNESTAIDISTEVEASTELNESGTATKAPEVRQRAVDSQVTINLIGKRDSVLLTAIIAMSNMILRRVANQDYGITYLNRSTTIFNGLLHRFATSPGSNDDLIRIDMTISNAKQKDTKEQDQKSAPIGKTSTSSLFTVPR